MRKAIAVILATLLTISFLASCHRTEEDILVAQFVEYVKTEASKQGVSAEYLLECGDISFEEWKESNAG